MVILHYYTAKDGMTADYVSALVAEMAGMRDGVGRAVESLVATDSKQARTMLREKAVDIVNIHGCWRYGDAMVWGAARRAGARIVVTPHGELEPWIVRQDYMRDKMPKTLLYQKAMVERAYAVVVMGKMEAACMRRLGWNGRIETILNALITETTTAVKMASETVDIYNKVMDTDVYQLMDAGMRLTLASLLKAGLSGDSRYLTQEEAASCRDISLLCWRRMLVYAHHTKISATLMRGAEATGVEVPDIDPTTIACYLPHPTPTETEAMPTDIVGMTRWLRDKTRRRAITIADIVATADRLRALRADEDSIVAGLRQRHLHDFACNLMYVLREHTRLEEGFMLTPPTAGGKARAIDSSIASQLRI